MTEATGTPSFTETLAAVIAADGEQAEGGAQEDPTGTPEGEPTPAPATPQTVIVKVDGREMEVPLEEAIQGYSRTADYTRKTQELKAQQQRLAEAEAVYAALNDDPKAALTRLHEMFDVPAPQANPYGEPDEELDPLERDVLELKSFAEQQREAQYIQQVEADISQTLSAYGDSTTSSIDLLQYAVDHEINNFDEAYKAMKFPEFQAIALKQRAAEDAAVLAAKQAANVVEGGSSRSGGTVTGRADGKYSSFGEAFLEAAQENLA